MDKDLALLRREFSAEEGSFLSRLRIDREWDKEVFSRLVAAMERCARAHEGRVRLDRWVAQGYWFLERSVPDWTSHEHFPRPHGEDYYREGCRRFEDLAYWYFTGESPYQGDGPLEPL